MDVSRANETEEQSVARMEANKVRIKRKRENETTDECDMLETRKVIACLLRHG